MRNRSLLNVNLHLRTPAYMTVTKTTRRTAREAGAGARHLYHVANAVNFCRIKSRLTHNLIFNISQGD